MRHRKASATLNRTTAHKRCLMANMLKAFFMHERIVTTVAKGKELRSYADKMITLAKKNSLDAKRRAIAEMMVSFNPLTSKELKDVKKGNQESYNDDRKVIEKLFSTIAPRFAKRAGGYTRLVKYERRRGDNGETCVLELVTEVT